MATRNPLLPSKDQCYSLTDAQCYMIQDYLDPQGQRAHKNWEYDHQTELIRQYMTMKSFPQIEEAMKPRLEWSYKTYSNRFRDWLFPVDRVEREQLIVELFALVTGSTVPNSSSYSASPHNSYPPSPHSPYAASPGPHTPLMLPARQIQPHPSTPRSQTASPVIPMSAPNDFFSIPVAPPLPMERNPALDRLSIATTNTWASGSTMSSYFDDTFSNHRLSVDTTNSSISAMSQSSIPRSHPEPPRRRIEPPRHDPKQGLWNNVLRVIPCGANHSGLQWQEIFGPCQVCGFSQWHALAVHAHGMDFGNFLGATKELQAFDKLDYAGNHPIHFLMSTGISKLDYYFHLLRMPDSTGQNSFGQNPLHVLNPLDLGDQLITILEYFKKSDNPPGLLHTQRDINCRTPLHALLQYPLERTLYQKILRTFLYAEHQLRSFDTFGRNAIKMMNKTSFRLKTSSYTSYSKIQIGITEVKLFLSSCSQTTGTPTSHPQSPGPSSSHQYGFHDIARGARGTSYMGGTFFQCRICGQTNAHTNSYRDQMECACAAGRDRNGPDETGMTPAHAIVTQSRCNTDSIDCEPRPETSGETAELFRILIPKDDVTLREALHVLDPEGNSLIYNVATRGLHEILDYSLALETPARRKAMVNVVGYDHNLVGGKIEWSVLRAVLAKRKDIYDDLGTTRAGNEYDVLCDKANRLTMCKNILLREGAEMDPVVATRWRIVWPGMGMGGGMRAIGVSGSGKHPEEPDMELMDFS